MHVSLLELIDFRSYPQVDIALSAGVSAFFGPNGQGKTNLVEAVDYIATQSSHRVSSDQPLVRAGAERAVVRAAVQRDERRVLIEIELNPGRSNRARLNRGQLPRAREALGILRTVVFSPEDLELVKGDPSARRRFLDELLVARQPRFAAVRSDYDRVLRQRNTLLRSAGGRGRSARTDSVLSTLEVWDAQLARTGGELLAARLGLTADLRPHLNKHYTEVAQTVSKAAGGNDAEVEYKPSFALPEGAIERDDLAAALLAEIGVRREDELDRGVTLVGPHRDEVTFTLGALPAKGYSSHGESWSFALALRLAAFSLLRTDGDDPVLILDDVFAELDDARRARLAALVRETEQVLVTAAVPADVPADLIDHRFDVRDGSVRRA